MPVFLLSDMMGFPPAGSAREDGLLAVGGDLRPERVEQAYRCGIFPWYSQNEPILWWSPDPRLVLYPNDFKISRRLRREMRQGRFRITADTAFQHVISACASSRTAQGEGTWIVNEMIDTYTRLYHRGIAHSIEAWEGRRLVGGLYGLSLGRAFFGESMFSLISNASKVALVHLMAFLDRQAFHFLDCQVTTGHLLRFGACEIPRRRFLEELESALAEQTLIGPWTETFNSKQVSTFFGSGQG
ncbi:MAG: leucyl/phenylalanyl-tRNA--protein transferase [Desulfobacterales bacterium]|nr:leucyl/phenylalanyl-tRNA--protein transferase [Desulfobacterales bacterium]